MWARSVAALAARVARNCAPCICVITIRLDVRKASSCALKQKCYVYGARPVSLRVPIQHAFILPKSQSSCAPCICVCVTASRLDVGKARVAVHKSRSVLCVEWDAAILPQVSCTASLY